MKPLAKQICNSLVKLTLGAACYLCLASFGSPTAVESEPLMVSSPTFSYYPEYQFYKDAYNYRLNNKIEIPSEYYEKLNIPNPTPVVAKQIPTAPLVILTQAQKDKALIPEWILTGMLMRETTSYYSDSGSIVYVDKRVGSAGERGPFQMKRICFDTISKPSESFYKLAKNTTYAEGMTVRYLLYLYNGPAHQNWKTTIGMYNVGPSNYKRYNRAANEYYTAVKNFGEQ